MSEVIKVLRGSRRVLFGSNCTVHWTAKKDSLRGVNGFLEGPGNFQDFFSNFLDFFWISGTSIWSTDVDSSVRVDFESCISFLVWQILEILRKILTFIKFCFLSFSSVNACVLRDLICFHPYSKQLKSIVGNLLKVKWERVQNLFHFVI